jgi:hypothetical protein
LKCEIFFSQASNPSLLGQTSKIALLSYKCGGHRRDDEMLNEAKPLTQNVKTALDFQQRQRLNFNYNKEEAVTR